MTETIADKEHAVLGPSGWDRWSACPGSVVLEQQFPNVASIYAATGSVAHEVAAQCLTDNVDAEEFVGKVFIVPGQEMLYEDGEPVGYRDVPGGHNITVDMEMADAVNDYIATVRTFIGDDDILLVEQAVPIGHLTGEIGAEGTADVIGICAAGTKLVVIDFKYGKGVRVWAKDDSVVSSYAGIHIEGEAYQINGQGGMYGCGGLEKFGLIYEDIAEVEIAIVQPRLDHVDSVTISVDQLREFGTEVTLAAGMVEMTRVHAQDKDEKGGYCASLNLHPGEKQCKFCRAKSVCPALAAEVSSSMALVSAADPEEFADLTLPRQAASVVVDAETDAERLSAAMRAAPLVEEFLKAIRAEVERRLLAGAAVPGFKIVQGKKGNRQWADPETVEGELKKRLGAKNAYVKKLISVTEAEKLFKPRPRTWAKIAPLITQADGKPSVALESDPRPPMQLGADPQDFPDLTALDDAESIALEQQHEEDELEALTRYGVTAHDLFDSD
jgi:hypothetical protein